MTRVLTRRAILNVFKLNCRSLYAADSIKSKAENIDIPNQTIPEFVFSKTSQYSKLIAYECGITGRKYTYEEVRTKSFNLNKSLRKKFKLQRGDIVALLLPNIPEFPIATLGVLLAGLRLTTLNAIYTKDEIKRQLDDSGAKIVITINELFPVVKSATTSNKLPIISISCSSDSTTPADGINFKELTDVKVDMPDVYIEDSNEIAVMPYSSGTTGLPKGVLLSHRNIISNILQFNSPDFCPINKATDTYQEVIPAVLPLFHIYGFSALALSNMCSGAKTVTLPKFAPDTFLKTLIDHKPTTLFTVPPIVIFLYSHPAVNNKVLGNLHLMVCGAAPLGALDEQKFKDKLKHPVDVLQGYGLTESSPVVTLGSVKHGLQMGSVGKIVPNTQCKLLPIDKPFSNNTLGPNEVGELYVKGPQVMSGYHNRPQETEETLRDGWLRTGDMFYYDENENFFATDRIKELIKVKGFQVPPAELEEIIRDFKNVNDAAVIGVPHKLYGEVPRAYVVAKPNTTIDMSQLHAYINEKVAEYKQIQGGIVVVESIPKSAAGKILRRQLKLEYLGEKA